MATLKAGSDPRLPWSALGWGVDVIEGLGMLVFWGGFCGLIGCIVNEWVLEWDFLCALAPSPERLAFRDEDRRTDPSMESSVSVATSSRLGNSSLVLCFKWVSVESSLEMISSIERVQVWGERAWSTKKNTPCSYYAREQLVFKIASTCWPKQLKAGQSDASEIELWAQKYEAIEYIHLQMNTLRIPFGKLWV
jgi:hypothetical protein